MHCVVSSERVGDNSPGPRVRPLDTPCMSSLSPSARDMPCSRRAAWPFAHLAVWPSFAAGACSAWMPLEVPICISSAAATIFLHRPPPCLLHAGTSTIPTTSPSPPWSVLSSRPFIHVGHPATRRLRRCSDTVALKRSPVGAASGASGRQKDGAKACHPG